MSQTSEQNIFFLYELGHVDVLKRFIDENPQIQKEGYLIVALGLELEDILRKRSIPFRSAGTYRPRDTTRFRLAQEWAERLTGPEWNWFEYRGIALSQLFFISIRLYLLYLLYYATIFENLLLAHPSARRLIVFPSSHALHTTPSDHISPIRQQPLLREQLAAVVACAKLVGSQRGVEVLVPEAPVQAKRARFGRISFARKRKLLEWGIDVYNFVIGLLRRHGTPRILASDYWRNVAPVMSRLPQGELMLFDRGEVFKAGVRNLWRSRIRLYNFNSFSIRDRKKQRVDTGRLYNREWQRIREHAFIDYSSGGFSVRPLLVEALDELFVQAVPAALRDIDGAYAMLKRLAPEIVLLRASISLQTHFYILAQVARAVGIPSLELQHGLEDLGPTSFSSKWHSAEYVAVYGKLVQDEFVALGLPREKFPIVGSPRFDVYKELAAAAHTPRAGKEGFSVLCVGTAVGTEAFYDTYDAEGYYRAVAQALEKIPNSSAVIKLRAGHSHQNFYRAQIDTLFARVPHTIAEYEPFPELFASADVVVSYFSTVILEALQFNKPTIVFSLEAIEQEMQRFHFTQYAKAGALLTVYTQEELERALHLLAADRTAQTRLSEHAGDVLARLHSFDGEASTRIVKLIDRLSRERTHHNDQRE
jgi:hypothetical protein